MNSGFCAFCAISDIFYPIMWVISLDLFFFWIILNSYKIKKKIPLHWKGLWGEEA